MSIRECIPRYSKAQSSEWLTRVVVDNVNGGSSVGASVREGYGRSCRRKTHGIGCHEQVGSYSVKRPTI